ncbi:hormogonium polysaccharide secretion pseudopilin HpsB [Lyngbya sp. PCC 8106]|uniref:hormogonium polysaccharide secretion pseudopilin HpsB n=1 Tax=Lyngbya sp. (strain PCC 8106) TaxID=313612 RepID=UPI0000EAAA74|nr:hormogonium polysaccharide secretion pseudopilin HpsB [Lyngbya sp. PCC 8106]EAW35924.1 hypothetical protein L8106_07616 [Lyngbya sp. PCC 8106]
MKKLIHQRNPCQSEEAGYALIESLIAIVVVAILMTAVTPMIVFSMGARMQAKRIQLATQASQSYLADLKANPKENDGLAPSTEEDIANIGDLTGDCEDSDGYCSYQADKPETGRTLYCVNFDEEEGCQKSSMVDMVVWPIREVALDTDNNPIATDLGYNLSLRVYRANSFADDVGALKQDGEVDSSVAQALGNRTLPLFQTATFISPSASADRSLYNSYCERTNGCVPPPSP